MVHLMLTKATDGFGFARRTMSTVSIKEYYKCLCGKYYKDADGKEEITDLVAWKAGEGRIDSKHRAKRKESKD